MKKYADEHRRPPMDLHEEKMAYLSTKNLRLGKNSCRKLGPTYIGPFCISQVIKADSAIELELPSSMRIYNVFHPSLLKRAHPITPNGPRLPPKLSDQEPEYEVEAILQHQFKNGSKKYLVHWKNYSAKERTWEPRENLLEDIPLMIRSYKENLSSKQQTTRPKSRRSVLLR